MPTPPPVPPPNPATPPLPARPERSEILVIKETVTALLIAFVLAFVFRGFVIEAFIIPTGSMAPTLRGAHVLLRAPDSGTTWAIEPQHQDSFRQPLPLQETINAPDPITGDRLAFKNVPRRAGDRIFVLKYLYAAFEPSRFDVVVFKNPSDPAQNFIKRLIGLPGEQIALVDGDVFTRVSSSLGVATGQDAWDQPGWRIARKPERVQRTVWHTIFDSAHTPITPERNGLLWYRAPWIGSTPSPPTSDSTANAPVDTNPQGVWSIGTSPSYRFSGSGRADLLWNEVQRPIDDTVPYNQQSTGYLSARFPVSDLRLSLGVEPATRGLSLWPTLTARGHAFQAEINAQGVAIRMVPVDELGQPSADWQTLSERATPIRLEPGHVTNIEFWHVDQTIQLWIDGRNVLSAEYDWSPAERFLHATGRTVARAIETQIGPYDAPFADPSIYRRPRIAWQFDGSPFTLHRVRIDRDLHYHQAGTGSREARIYGSDPRYMPALKSDQYFVCGDNSPISDDGRLWDTLNPWIRELDPDMGVVNRKLLIGRAFFVYFPAIHPGPLPVPDFGRMRFIW